MENKNNKVFTKVVEVEEFGVKCTVTREMVDDLKNVQSFFDEDMEKTLEDYIKTELKKQKREDRLKKINEIFSD